MRQQHERFNSKNRATWAVVEWIDYDLEHSEWDQRALQLWQRAIRNKVDNPRSRAALDLAFMLEAEYRSRIPFDLDPRHEELLECALIEVDWVGIASRLVIDALLCRAPRPTGLVTPPALQDVRVPIGELSVSPRLRLILSHDLLLQELAGR